LELFVDHFLIVVKDLEESLNFYKLLGFKHIETIQRSHDVVSVMQKERFNLELMMLPIGKETYRVPRIETDIGFRHIGFKVKDIQAAYEYYKDKIEFKSPLQVSSGRGNRKILFFEDPNGLELHFIQE
jgi:catechol 2,3-dioxygenase-like lactoylglutathione lyase family enzyme